MEKKERKNPNRCMEKMKMKMKKWPRRQSNPETVARCNVMAMGWGKREKEKPGSP
jgi:hypothetical protein